MRTVSAFPPGLFFPDSRKKTNAASGFGLGAWGTVGFALAVFFLSPVRPCAAQDGPPQGVPVAEQAAAATPPDGGRPVLAPLALPRMPDGFYRRIIAEVGGRPVMLSTAFEQWGPVWEELAEQAMRGKLPPDQYERELKEEWDKALNTAVRDELFYLEARYTFERLMTRMLEQLERQTGNSLPRAALEAQVRRELDADLRRQFERIQAEAQAAAGGPAALQRNLARRGLAQSDWNERLERRAFIGFYFALNAKPSLRQPTPHRIREYYARHKDTEFVRPGRAIFRHIYFANERSGGAEGARERAVECWQKLAAGEISFPDAAAAHSDDIASRDHGGLDNGAPDTARPEREVWLRAVRDAVRDETPGELGGILESDFGSHLAMLLDIMPATTASFSEVQEEIRSRIAAEDQRREMDEIAAKLAKETPVRVLMPRFPPECGWATLAAQGAPGTRPTLRRVY